MTKRRSGRGSWPASWREAKRDTLDRKMRQNVGFDPQPHVSLAAPFVPFGVPRRDRRGAFTALVKEGPGRGDPEAFATVGLHKQPLGRAVLGKCAEGRERRSARTVGFSTGPPKRGRKPTLFGQITFSRSLRSPGSPSFSPVDKSLGLSTIGSSGAQRSLAPVPLHATGLKSSKDWGHNSVVELPKRPLTRASKRWNAKEEAMDREAKMAKRSPAPSRSTGFRFAPTGTEKRARRPAGRSVARTVFA